MTTTDQQTFRDVIGHFASGVTVLTTRGAGEDFGATASAVSSLSLDPPMLLVCLNQGTPRSTARSANESVVAGTHRDFLSESTPWRRSSTTPSPSSSRTACWPATPRAATS
jgi:flavin reductase (DIM6/NTAB) family NADH-FMN oxidoreductase RutF